MNLLILLIVLLNSAIIFRKATSTRTIMAQRLPLRKVSLIVRFWVSPGPKGVGFPGLDSASI